MMFDVQNGIVHRRQSAICQVCERTWKARKKATVNPIARVKAQVSAA